MYARLALVKLKSVAAALRFGRSDSGQDLLEYGLLVSLIAIIAVGAVSSVGNAIHTVFWTLIAAAF
jgi:Flp pilus assembly pilin Flp